MLNKFLEKGIIAGLFEIKTLRDLDTNNRIQSNVEVIDFDKVKEVLIKTLNRNGVYSLELTKSCDALKIIPSENRLDFIEIKGIEIFCERNSHLVEDERKKAVEEQLEKFNLQNKIDHSLFLMRLLLQINQMGLNGKERAFFFNEIISEYIVVIDSEIENDGILEINAMLEFMSETSNIRGEFIIRLKEVLNDVSVLRLKEPRLMFQSEIDSFYEDFLQMECESLQDNF